MRKQVFLWASAGFLGIAACGDGSGQGSADAGPDANTLDNPGFAIPSQVTTAHVEEADGSWTEVGPADWSCLGTPDPLGPTTVEVQVSGTVEDFASSVGVGGAQVAAFAGSSVTDSPLAEAMAEDDGSFALTLGVGTDRIAYRVRVNRYLDTYLLNQRYAADQTEQSQTIRAISAGLADALPATINKTRTPGLGTLAGAIRDCQGREVGGAIATVSSASARAEHLGGAETYYFSAGATQSLPVLHSVQPATNTDGLFVVFDLPPTTSAYLQVWGFTGDQDPDVDEPQLLSEIAAPILEDTVITASMVPLQPN